jgi:hypothetical protein
MIFIGPATLRHAVSEYTNHYRRERNRDLNHRLIAPAFARPMVPWRDARKAQRDSKHLDGIGEAEKAFAATTRADAVDFPPVGYILTTCINKTPFCSWDSVRRRNRRVRSRAM